MARQQLFSWSSVTIGSASALQEDLKGPAEYAAQYWEPGDVIALPDHAITSAIDYYLTNARRPILLWPQLGVRQRYVEGFDLLLHPSGHDPRRVWLVSDGSVAGVTRFEKLLDSEGYVIRGFRQFNGSSILLYYSTQPTTSIIAALRWGDAQRAEGVSRREGQATMRSR